ncbi:MAG: sigma-54-dependent Fis family transcriptional regulator, partial [Proteobacteria bacterium]|nr:sigma-54-dependent Fis family transcriptional regulator [Pseudomonadota bacterium]
AARILLSTNGYAVTTEEDPEKIPGLINAGNFDLILLDMNFSRGVVHGKEGFRWLQVILDIDPASVVILITAYGDIELAVEAMQNGASDFIQKPWDNQKLLSTVSIASELNDAKKRASLLKVQNKFLSGTFSDIIGESKPMQSVFNMIDKVSMTDANVLLTGENGTGKDLIARAIHKRSTRADSVFLGVDMGSIPETLFESEMFGHKKGAFTGA